jgi:hypothetical protein
VAVRWFTDATWDVRARQFIALLEVADEPT